MSTMEPEVVNSVPLWTAHCLPWLFVSRFYVLFTCIFFCDEALRKQRHWFEKPHPRQVFFFLHSALPLLSLWHLFCSLFLSDVAEQVFVYAEQAVDILSTGSIWEHQGLIAVCIDPSVISWCSLPCRPANNQHPLCAYSRSLSSLSSPSFLPPPPHLMPVATTTSPTLPLFPCCSGRTKKEAISSLREEWWKWRRRESGCISVKVAMVRWVWERNSKLVKEVERDEWKERATKQRSGTSGNKGLDSWGKRFRKDKKKATRAQNRNNYRGKAD